LPAKSKEAVAIAIDVLTIFNTVKFLGVEVYLQPLLRYNQLIKDYSNGLKNLRDDT
jgi:hypothetical protein